MDANELKALRDEAKGALEEVSKTVDQLRKDQDVLVDEKLNRVNEDFGKKYEAWEAESKKLAEKADAADKRAEQLEARIAKLNAARDEGKANGKSEAELKFCEAFFNGFVRKGDTGAVENFIADNPEHVKRLTADNDAQAGYLLAPETLDAEITRIVTEISPVRQFADVQTISTQALEKNVNFAGSAAGWEDADTDASVENTNPSFKKLRFPVHGLRAVYHASPNILDDARVNVEELFAREMGIAMGEVEAEAFVDGDGVAKPRGFLDYTKTITGSYTGAWESIEYHITGADGAFQAAGSGPEEVFLDTIHSMKQPYQANARFYMNRSTLAEVRKVKDADGRPLFMWDGGMPATIAGEPFTIFQQMPDVASDSYSIAYADLRAGYQVVERSGLTVLRDPFSSKPNVEFFGRKRVGGGVKMFEAIKLIRFAD